MKNKQAHEISVRYHDCDPYRHLNTANYLRFMFECDLADYESRGHGLREFVERGKIWRARRCFADFMTPLFYGDEIQVIARTHAVDDVQVYRTYEIYSAGFEQPAAAGEILWELVDLESGRAGSIPDDLKADLFPDAAESVPVMDFPEGLSSRPQGAYSVRRIPEWRDGGPGYHLNFSALTDYFVYTTLEAAASRGWTLARSDEEGLAYVIRRLWIDFLQPLFVWDELELETWLSNIRRFTVLRNYTARTAGKQELFAWGKFLYAAVDMNSGRPARFPGSIWEEFTPQISPDDLLAWGD